MLGLFGWSYSYYRPSFKSQTSTYNEDSSTNMSSLQNAIAWRQLQLSRAKLKASSRTSALLAGFAMVALVELDLVDRSPVAPSVAALSATAANGTSAPSSLAVATGGVNMVSSGVIIAFGICTTLLVSVHLLALMMSTCILPYMEAAGDGGRNAAHTFYDSLHTRMRWYIELAWFFSTVLGLLLFLLEIGIVCWIKFYGPMTSTASYVTTAMLVPVFIVFIWFTYTFYNKLTRHNYEASKIQLDALEAYCSRLTELETVTVTTTSVQDANDKLSSANEL